MIGGIASSGWMPALAPPSRPRDVESQPAPAALTRTVSGSSGNERGNASGNGTPAEGGVGDKERPAGSGQTGGQQLSKEERAMVAKLEARDREVRAHEMAHIAAGGGIVRGGPSYTFQTGPDGKRYAIGGEVQIDTSPGKTPQETLEKAQKIRAAALAPAQPSSTDLAVAADAAQMAAEAQQEIARQKAEGSSDGNESERGESGEAAGEAGETRDRDDATRTARDNDADDRPAVGSRDGVAPGSRTANRQSAAEAGMAGPAGIEGGGGDLRTTGGEPTRRSPLVNASPFASVADRDPSRAFQLSALQPQRSGGLINQYA